MEMQLTETENVEYKRRITGDIEKTVIGYLNTSGGELHIGVDPDNFIYGLDNYDEEARKFMDRVRNNISPSTLGLFSISPRMGKNGKAYLIITIASGYEKPYYLKEFGMSPKGCFMRLGTATVSMPQDMIDALFARRSLHSLRNTLSPNQKLKFEQLRIYYSEKGFTVDNDHFLDNLDLYTADGKFNYLAYLMADINGVSIKIAQYADGNKVKILQKTECGHCSLIKATKSMLTALDLYNRTAVELTYPDRIDTRLVDTDVLREAVINAIIHNDYIRGSYPVVEFYPDRVEITSSGGLPTGLTKEEFFKGRSHPRNREIMRIFKDMGLCEQLGSGMKRIMEKYKQEDFEISENFVTACFKFNEHALKILNGKTEDRKSVADMNEMEFKVYAAICESSATTRGELAVATGISESSVKSAVTSLIKKGFIERVGSDKTGKWIRKS